MAIDWREFLVVAHNLKSRTDEGSQRTSLGRSYYYVFNLVLAEAKTSQFNGTLPGLHKKLWQWCASQNNPQIKQLGALGTRMYALRIHADYNSANLRNATAEVQRQLLRVRDCEAIIASLNNTKAPPPLI